jgi:hypothetical protein
MIEQMSQQMFVDNVKSKFTVRNAHGNTFELDLVEVIDHGSTRKQEQFSLMFTGPVNAPAAQGIYDLQHEKLGAFQLFLVPVARDAQGLHYEAVINRFPNGM